jgi:hypothetical protein
MKEFRNKALRSIGLALCAFGLAWHLGLSAFGPALAAAIAGESFNYPVGELVGQNGGTGWGGAWGGQTANTEIASASLSYTVPGGGIVSGGATALQLIGNNDNAAFRTLGGAQSADSVFVSFLVQFTGTVDNNDFMGLWFDNVSTGDHRPAPSIGIKGNQEDGSGTSDFFARVFDDVNLASEVYSTDISASPAGTTFFVVGRLFKTVSGAANNYDRFSLWVNPAFGDEATPDATASVTGSPAIASFTTVGFRLSGIDAGDSILFDELCIGTTWQDCVPGCLITCPANRAVSNDPNQCGAVVSYPAPTTAGSCGTVTCSPASGSFFPKGTTTVTCTAQAGSSCTFTVTVNDTQPPTITCPPNVTAVAAPACPPAVSTTVTFPPPTATDNCPGVVVVCNPPSGSTIPVGVTTVTCTATDAVGNTATCSFTTSVFNACIQDDSNPANVILFNTFTGQYRACCGGTIFTGVGTVNAQGCDFTLQHNSATTRVTAKWSSAYFRGSGSVQSPPGSTKCVITDRDIRNNTCACGVIINGGT